MLDRRVEAVEHAHVLAADVHVNEGCDLLVVPAVPATLDTDGLVLTLQTLHELGTERYRVLLTKVPPPPESEGQQLRLLWVAIHVQGEVQDSKMGKSIFEIRQKPAQIVVMRFAGDGHH